MKLAVKSSKLAGWQENGLKSPNFGKLRPKVGVEVYFLELICVPKM
jgi:hypothetical protein